MPRSDELAVVAGERTVVDRELHLDRRRINRYVRQRSAQFRIANRFADEHFLEAGQPDDVAGVRFLNLDALHAFEMIDRGELALADLSIAMPADGGFAELHLAFVNFSERDTPEVIAVIEVGHEQLKTVTGPSARRRDVLDDRVEQRLHCAG